MVVVVLVEVRRSWFASVGGEGCDDGIWGGGGVGRGDGVGLGGGGIAGVLCRCC